METCEATMNPLTLTTEEIPRKLITKDFLEQQLQLEVESFHVSSGTKPGDNFMSVLYSISVKTGQGDMRHYMLKCYPSDPSRQQFLNKTNHFYSEVAFYTILVKDLIQFQTDVLSISKDQVIFPNIPEYHAGKAVNYLYEINEVGKEKIYSPLDNFILMTDLRKMTPRGYKMVDPKQGLDLDHLMLAFQELATLHAVGWAYRKTVTWDLLEKFPFLERPPKNAKKREAWLNLLKENAYCAIDAIDKVRGKGNPWSQAVLSFVENRGSMALEYFSSQNEELEMSLQKMLRNSEEYTDQWRVICHGDCWSNNMLFQYNPDSGKPERVVLVDFPLAKLGCPTVDLACLVYVSTRRHIRQGSCLNNCFQAYHNRFLSVSNKLGLTSNQLPVDFSVAAIKPRFQNSKQIGFLIALISLPSVLKTDERVSVSDTSIESNLYQEWIVELVDELHTDGVI